MNKDEIKKLIIEAIEKLVNNDDDIFKQKIPKLGEEWGFFIIQKSTVSLSTKNFLECS